MKKVKGFRKEHSLYKARFLKNNGAKIYQVVGYLCQCGWNRAAATRDAENL